MSEIEGVLVVDKPVGPTSHDVVARLRRVLGQRKVGHAGTLDPLASGVLPMVLGGATRFLQWLPHDPKVYRVQARLGLTTNTGDMAGEAIGPMLATAHLETAAVVAALAAMEGESEQLPPMFSARKVNGQPLYRAARRGLEVERRPTRVRIDSFRMLAHQGDCLELEVHCSPGTYVRTLVADLGQRLGTGATVSALRRARSGAFTLEHALEPDRLDSPQAILAALLPLDRVPLSIGSVEIEADSACAFVHGRAVTLADLGPPDGSRLAVRVASHLIGVAEVRTASNRARSLQPCLVRSSVKPLASISH